MTVYGDLAVHQRANLQPHNPSTEYDRDIIEDTTILQVLPGSLLHASLRFLNAKSKCLQTVRFKAFLA